MPSSRRTAPLLLLAALGLGPLLLASPAAAQAADPRPVAYINPDKGMATENPNVAESSECESPVQSDTQALGNEGDGTGNVHVDACLFDSGGMRVDTQAAFTVSGVGTISGCPDPDKEGPQTSMKAGNSCVLSNFEAANSEYHVRVVSAAAGQQTVTFCADPQGNGCDDATATSTVRVAWGSPAGGVDTGGSTDRGVPTGPLAVALVAFAAAAAAVSLAFRGVSARR